GRAWSRPRRGRTRRARSCRWTGTASWSPPAEPAGSACSRCSRRAARGCPLPPLPPARASRPATSSPEPRVSASLARRLAFDVLTDPERGDFVAERLARPDASALDPRERGFLHELVLGTLRQRGLVDHALQGALDRPLARVDAPVLTILRLGAYQLLRL